MRYRAGLLPSAMVAVLMLGAVPTAWAQWGSWSRAEPRFPTPEELKDRRFMFARVLYERVRREAGGQGWFTDYPFGDRNLMQRLGELTAMPVSTDAAGEPTHVVVRLTDDAIFSLPFLFMSDVGTVGFSDEEVARLRTYLIKGGFLYVDDFWGSRAWEHWEREIGKVLPRGEYPIFDVPLDHPLFHALYSVRAIPQIPSIQHWRRVGGTETSERGVDSAVPHLRAIADARGRLMVVMTHNTDIADGWEREGEEYEFFFQFSPDAYALATNIILYALTH